MKQIDLHIHTNASDGDYSPKEIIDLAIQKRMKIIAITDHDTISGLEEAIFYSKNKPIELILGIEISCEEKDIKHIHILGIFMDSKNKELNEFLLLQKKPSIDKAISLIKKSGGIPMLAHPGVYGNKMEEIIKMFIESGGKVMELNYPYDKIYGLDKQLILKKIKEIIDKEKLFISGGSDFHDKERGTEIGEEGISDEEFLILKKLIK
jgi:predicted metal-dependent phosphoesterase TrpH